MQHRPTRTIAYAVVTLLLLVAALPVSGAGPLSGKIVCLDPGHGGMDPGAYNGANDLRESDINLDEAYALSALLNGAGATVVMTRTGNQAKTESARAAFCNQAGATILVSVHTNSVADPNPDGSLTYYYKTGDVPLAQALHEALYSTLAPTAPAPADFIYFGARRFRAGVLRRSTMPGTVAEPVFLSSPGEAALLLTPIYTAPGSGVFSPGCPAFNCRRGQIAQALYRGVLAYFAASAK